MIDTEFGCSICERTFKSKRSLASHKNHHNPDYHTKSKAGAKSGQLNGSRAGTRKIIEEAKERYKNKKCSYCGLILPYERRENRHCNSSCAASNTNRTRIRIKKPKKKPLPKLPTMRDCVICNITFLSQTAKSCSPECKSKLISNGMKEAFLKGIHKGNQYRSRATMSYMEQSFNDWLLLEYPNVQFIREHVAPIINDGNYDTCYFIDFYFPDLGFGIELDGTHHKNQVDYDKKRDEDIKRCHDIDIFRINHKEYLSGEKIEFVKNLIKTR